MVLAVVVIAHPQLAKIGAEALPVTQREERQRKKEEREAMEESEEQCTVVFALIVTERASDCVGRGSF